MATKIIDDPDFSALEVTFDRAGDSLLVESGAMLARDSGVEMKTSMRGGVLASAKRKLLGGESLFMNTFTATHAGQRLWVAPPCEGDIIQRELAGETVFVQSGAYLASTPGLELDTKWAGVKGFFASGNLFFVKASGTGTLFAQAYGGLVKMRLDGQGMVVDTGHVVAFSDGLEYSIRKFGGFKGLFFSGEGLVAEFRGTGDLWIQSRNPSSLASFVRPYRPQRSAD